jgi:pyruvate dehydrogenase E1 component alpha subunit
LQYQDSDAIVVCFFGDGALNLGIFHESLNLASLWKLPMVFVCENNYYAMTTPLGKSTATQDIAKRAAAYDMPGKEVDGMDVLAVREAAAEAIDHARDGQGPTLLVCNTYRFLGHGRNPDTRSYRTKEEEAIWKARCPIESFKGKLLAEQAADEVGLQSIEEEVLAEVSESDRFAEESPFPDENVIYEDIYA